MLKYALLASALAIGAPAVAQDATTPQTAPEQQAPQPQQMEPATPDAATQAAPADQSATTSQPATGADQVAQVVKAEFPSYDKDSNGALNQPEFAEWMGALRKASEPAVDTQSAEVKTWIEGAFASADADKNQSVTEGELTTFLTSATQPS